MNSTEATANIIIAMINNKYLATPEDVSKAYKEVFKAVRYPDEN